MPLARDALALPAPSAASAVKDAASNFFVLFMALLLLDIVRNPTRGETN
jgi:hypothetical protein